MLTEHGITDVIKTKAQVSHSKTRTRNCDPWPTTTLSPPQFVARPLAVCTSPFISLIINFLFTFYYRKLWQTGLPSLAHFLVYFLYLRMVLWSLLCILQYFKILFFTWMPICCRRKPLSPSASLSFLGDCLAGSAKSEYMYSLWSSKFPSRNTPNIKI